MSLLTRAPGAASGAAPGTDGPPAAPNRDPGSGRIGRWVRRAGRGAGFVGRVVRGPGDGRPVSAASSLMASAMAVLGLLLLTFAAELTFVGSVRHAHAQSTGYDRLRSDLANAVVPVGPTDSSGRLVALGTPLALLDIPSIGLREVVFEGTTSSVLMSGPGHRRDTALPGQTGVSVIYGRAAAYGGPFGHLRSLRPGQSIVVVTGQGKQMFDVIGVRHAGDPIPQIAASGSLLTLTTADGPALAPTGLLRVDALLSSSVQQRPGAAFLPGRVPPPELAMAGDPSALMPLVLWAELLVIAAIGLAWARIRWGGWQTWVVGLPTLAFVCIGVTDHVAVLLPNLL